MKRDLKGADKKLRALDAPKKTNALGKPKTVLDTHAVTSERDEPADE